jgi:exodeoxyribonuclease VII small subunit
MATQTFESALKKLEKIVEELESGDLPLEKSLKKFEEGIELSRLCSKKLEETEAKITQLMADSNGDPVEASLDDVDLLTDRDDIEV